MFVSTENISRYYNLVNNRLKNLLSDEPVIRLLLNRSDTDYLEERLDDTSGYRIDIRLKIKDNQVDIVSAKKVKFELFAESNFENDEVVDYDIALLDKKKVLEELNYYRKVLIPILKDNLVNLEAINNFYNESIIIKSSEKPFVINPDGYIYDRVNFTKTLISPSISHGEILYQYYSNPKIIKKIDNVDFLNDLFNLYRLKKNSPLVIEESKLIEALDAILLPEYHGKRKVKAKMLVLKDVIETYSTEECLSLYNNPDVNIDELNDYAEGLLESCIPYEISTVAQIEERLKRLYEIRDNYPSQDEINKIDEKYLQEYNEQTKKKGFLEKLKGKKEKHELKHFDGYMGYANLNDVNEAIKKTLLEIEKRQRQEKAVAELNNNQMALAARRLYAFKHIYNNILNYNNSKSLGKKI